jgi:peroxiredoxin (alkyl hydroperoxide reductase subunit C)
MSIEELGNGLNLGQSVPDFEMDTYDPKEMFFGKISLEQLKKDGKWTILFFYPADFTFV